MISASRHREQRDASQPSGMRPKKECLNPKRADRSPQVVQQRIIESERARCQSEKEQHEEERMNLIVVVFDKCCRRWNTKIKHQWLVVARFLLNLVFEAMVIPQIYDVVFNPGLRAWATNVRRLRPCSGQYAD